MSEKPFNILVACPLPEDLIVELSKHASLTLCRTGDVPDDSEIRELLPTVDGVITTGLTKYTRGLLTACPNLKVISLYAVGYDNMDMRAASELGITVCNTPKVLDDAVAELTIGLLISLARQIPWNDGFVRRGDWAHGIAPLNTSIGGRRLGIVGMGRIGARVAEIAKVLGAEIVYNRRNRDELVEQRTGASYESVDRIFETADFVSLHLPLTSETRHSIGRRELGLMKKSAYLINMARGGVVVEDDLIDALRNGKIAGAALDVMAVEPLPTDSPLCHMSNVILQPHAGSATVETRRAMIELAVRNIANFARDMRPEAIVNPATYESRR